MSAAQWFLLTGFVIFVLASLRMVLQVVWSGRSSSLAVPKGKPVPAVLYSLTGAMLPWKKESARLHLVIYVLGAVYHIGTFLSFFWLIALFVHASLPPVVTSGSAVLLTLTTLCGLVLLGRRVASSKLRYFSSPDDYFSNLLVTGFHALTVAALLHEGIANNLFIYAGILLLYIPLGKLRHAVYFALARFHLGLFYGRRGVWPAEGGKSWRA
jgi:nitrate reductase gamma subunit